MIPLPVVDPLDSITIPVACPVPWDTMHGDHRTRFCDQCSQNVHDVSELTRAEAVELVTGGEKLPCLRLYRRPDGRVMTADCMTRRERAWKWLHKRSTWAAALFALVFMGCTQSHLEPGESCMGDPAPQPLATDHEDEHTARTPSAGDHAPPAHAMDATTRAEMSVRHESEATARHEDAAGH
jgi:hypothetical protein